MTSTSLPPDLEASIRKALRERAQAWIARFYRHELLVARTVRGMQAEAVDLFQREVVRPIIQTVAGRLSTFDLRGNNIVIEAFPELRALTAEVERVAAQGSDAVRRLTTERLKAMVDQEREWIGDTARRALKVDVPDPQVSAEQVLARPWLGDSTERWFQKALATPAADHARRVIQTGLQQGWSETDIVRALRGTPAQPGALTGPTRMVESLVRTAASSANAQTRAESFKAIGVKTWRFVATLDERTSIQCASLDGKVYPVGKGPIPPLHPNCRSVAVPDFGDPVGNRASVDGPVPADTTFRQWIEDQPKGVQIEVLGKTRAEAWRAGKLSFDQMVGRDLQPLTVAELRRLDRIE